jgi:hypothetical protein
LKRQCIFQFSRKCENHAKMGRFSRNFTKFAKIFCFRENIAKYRENETFKFSRNFFQKYREIFAKIFAKTEKFRFSRKCHKIFAKMFEERKKGENENTDLRENKCYLKKNFCWNPKNAVVRSRSWIRKGPHHLVRAGAVMRCSSGSSSENGIKHG